MHSTMFAGESQVTLKRLMPKKDGTVRVKAVKGEAMRYLVESWGSSQEPHMVDLLANGGNGACDCVDYQTRCFPNFKEIGKPVDYWKIPRKGVVAALNPQRTRCRHITASMKKWTEDTLRDINNHVSV